MNYILAAKRPFSIEDIADIRSVSNVQLSPDGKFAVCVITSTINISYRNDIVLIDTSSAEQKNITTGSSPQWSPGNNEIAYIGDNNGASAIFIYNLLNNSNELLVNIYQSDYFVDHYANNNFCWSPDGKIIAYICAASFAADTEKVSVREFTNLLYKTKGGKGRQIYFDQQYNHIWLINVREKIARPVFESGYNEHSICWSPDNKRICFISNKTGKADINQCNNVFAVDILTGEVNKGYHEKGSAFQPAWSPDGKYIAYVGILSEISTNDSPAEDTQLYIVPSTGGPATCLTRFLDRRIEQVTWDPSSQYIYFTSGNKGNTFLYRIAVLSGKMEIVIDLQGKVIEYSVGNDGENIIYVHTDTLQFGDVFIFNLHNHLSKRLTDTGKELSGKCLFQPAETFLV